jgi:hypothetical protein
MQIKRLEDMFANAKGTTTAKGAETRLAKFEAWLAACENLTPVRAFILTRADGTFIPVILLDDKTMWMMHKAIDCGCCVTN